MGEHKFPDPYLRLQGGMHGGSGAVHMSDPGEVQLLTQADVPWVLGAYEGDAGGKEGQCLPIMIGETGHNAVNNVPLLQDPFPKSSGTTPKHWSQVTLSGRRTTDLSPFPAVLLASQGGTVPAVSSCRWANP